MRSVSAVLVAWSLVVSVPATAQQGSPAGLVPPQVLRQRRALLLDRIGEGVVILRSARLQDMEGEDFPQASDFRQDNDFFYLAGLETASSWLVLIAHTGAPDQVILYIPQRNPAEEMWTGARLGAAEAATQSAIADIRPSDKAASEISPLLSPRTAVYVKLPGAAGVICDSLAGPRGRDCNWLFLQPLKQAMVELRDVRPHLSALRLIKDEEELRRMRRAIAITGDALRDAMQRSKPGAWEYEIESWIEQVFHAAGAERVGFPSIVGSGPNATTLHYDKNRRRTVSGDLVVMDVGAEFGYYTADITRTMPISGRFTDRQRALYNLVLASQQAALDSVKPGMTLPRLDEIARDYMRRNSRGLCGPRPCDQYFVHGLSHWLGMDVHDAGSLATPLAAGMVLTVEPGIYLDGEGLGIRIEDDVLVTAAGYELLSGSAPRRAEDIERLMNSANR